MEDSVRDMTGLIITPFSAPLLTESASLKDTEMCVSLHVCVSGGRFNYRHSLSFPVLIPIVFVTCLT